MNDNILVIGGTGKTGRKVVQRLQEKNIEVRIGSRSAQIPFDWHDPSTWAAALEGMDKVYITFQPDLAVPGAYEAIQGLTEEAKRQGVRKLVILSGKGEKEAQRSEQVLIHSGLDYSIVRATWFSQNFSESFLLDPILAGQVALPKADTKVAFVDTDDIADMVVEALLKDVHNGEIFDLTGPRLINFREAVQEIASATGRTISFHPVSLEAYSEMLKQVGLGDDYVWLVNYLFSEVLGNEQNSYVSSDIERVLGRKAKDFSQYVKETAATGVWNQREKIS